MKACCHDLELQRLVEAGFSMEAIGLKDPIQSLQSSKNAKKLESHWSPVEKLADDKMKVTHIPKTDLTKAHYECAIPWKHGVKPDLTNNSQMIKVRQSRTTSKNYLLKKGTSMDEIKEYFAKLEAKGYISKIDNSLVNEVDSYYLPWFPVIDRQRETTKMRIVFDASAKDGKGKSLNSEIENTPNRLNDLATLIMRFRMYKYTLTADISEMFLCIKMIKQDRKYHRFFVDNQLYQWNSIIFGEMSSPDISQKVITLCALSQDLPMAQKIVTESTYMDDTIHSSKSVEEIVESCQELMTCYSKAGMPIGKFYSNSPEVLKIIPRELHSKKVSFDHKDPEIEASKVLGMIYDAKQDQFTYKCKFDDAKQFFVQKNLPENEKWTKRLILKFSATCYDPLGFISPFTVRSRSILQALWTIKLNWDDPIPELNNKSWNEWISECFELVNLVSIPRHLQMDDAKKLSLHVFVDASTTVYAAVAYLVVENLKIKTSITYTSVENKSSKEAVFSRGEKVQLKPYIVMAKARVTPTKTESVSRLELAACVIGVRLGHLVAKAYDICPEDIKYWTDSKNCLYWVNTPSNLLKTFVAHRVGEIQNYSTVENWRHVPTDINPADIATRPPQISALSKNRHWWNGPEFLTKPETSWPEKWIPTKVDKDGLDEFKVIRITRMVATPDAEIAITRYLDMNRIGVGKYWSCWPQMQKRASIFVSNMLDIPRNVKTFFAGQKMLAWFAQRDSPELSELKNRLMRDLPLCNKKYTNKYDGINPYIDADDLIRSKTRLNQLSTVSYEKANPIVLDKFSRFTQVLVEHYHWTYGHAVGDENIKAQLRQRYHIMGLNQLVKSIRAKCVECQKTRAKAHGQQMGPLPEYRFSRPLSAFAKTGLDFAGPFDIKVGRGRARQKCYILVLTCMQTRAIHLEVTDSQDMTAVMNALSRFVDLRGMPTDILSDNFSTFISKDKELQSWVRYLDKDMLIETAKAEINWHFTPPLAPHQGGIYESMVKSAKRALKTIADRENLNFDEFRTFVSNSAAMLNGRPLQRVTHDNSSYVLTPNHFLVGNLGGAVTTKNVGPNKRWKQISRLLDGYWKIFMEHYLPELKRLRKWKAIKPNICEGQIVLELEPGIATSRWKLAKVVEVLPSSDGNIRKVLIKNSKGLFERAITSLCPLELE